MARVIPEIKIEEGQIIISGDKEALTNLAESLLLKAKTKHHSLIMLRESSLPDIRINYKE